MRDAVVAAATLNIFHKHADRVRLTDIAQMVNVLQAMILTDGDRKILTPTYWVYDLYKPFQGATSLPVEVESPAYAVGAASVPTVTASAGRDAAGVVHLALVNLDPNKSATVRIKLSGVTGKSVDGRVLTAPAMASHNTFAAPNLVKPVAFKGATIKDGVLTAVLPAKAVAVLDLR